MHRYDFLNKKTELYDLYQLILTSIFVFYFLSTIILFNQLVMSKLFLREEKRIGRLNGKVAIITGGGSGLGKGAALAMAKEGAMVAITDLTLERLQTTQKLVEALGGKCLSVACDSGKRDQVKACIDKTVATFGTVDILVNNAMSVRKESAVIDIDDEELDFALRVGLYGVLYMMQEVFPYMKNKQNGRIINIGSSAASTGLEGRGVYASVKGGVHSLTRVAGREWGPFGITVNLVSPVALNERHMEIMEKNPEYFNNIAATMPLRRWGRAEEDFGRTLVWLASDDADYITLNNILVDGGSGQTR